MFTNPAFLNAVQNTLVITAFQLVFFFPIPILLALLLNSVVTPRLRTIIQCDRLPAPLLLVGAGRDRCSSRSSAARGCINQTLRDHGLGPGST